MAPLEVLAAYPDDCRPLEIESLGSAGGFSGAKFWRIRAACGTLCLRCWPQEHPPPEGLEFIQAVLWHVTREGFVLVPLPRETRRHAGYVRHDGYLWQLEPWMPGEADFRKNPTDERLTAAVAALAEFHQAASSFPLPDAPLSPSPGIGARLGQLRNWLDGDLDRLRATILPGTCPELASRAARVCSLVPLYGSEVLTGLNRCSFHRVAIQPCIRDIWHAHVLFEGGRVSGLIDFGSLRAESVAADLARLLGSLAGGDIDRWRLGLDAYRAIRPLSEAELDLIEAFDRSSVLMSGLNWIDWIYRQKRAFENRNAIPGRLDEILARLEQMDRAGPLR
jgi:Ser/Thr protein kinase RdoA (MazF antagonist)